MIKHFDFIFIPAVILVCLLIGLLLGDIIGGATLAFGFLSAYYSAVGKWFNYIFGIVFSLFYAYINFINGLYGLVIFTFVVYLPVQIYGIVGWFKKKDNDGVVFMKSLKAKQAILMCGAIIVFSLAVGLGLSLIPSQNLPFLDSCSQLINVAGVLLCSLRFRECWYIWLANNVIDLSIWIINLCSLSPGSLLMLITAIMYLIMNVVGLINWIKTENKQMEENKA